MVELHHFQLLQQQQVQQALHVQQHLRQQQMQHHAQQERSGLALAEQYVRQQLIRPPLASGTAAGIAALPGMPYPGMAAMATVTPSTSTLSTQLQPQWPPATPYQYALGSWPSPAALAEMQQRMHAAYGATLSPMANAGVLPIRAPKPS